MLSSGKNKKNVHLQNELINIQNKLEEKIANLSEETVKNVAGEISVILQFKERLNDNVTVLARGIEERIMAHLNQEKSSMRAVISEVIADLTAINDSFIDEIERCFDKLSNQTKKLNNLSLNVSQKHSACNKVMSKDGPVLDTYVKQLKQIVPVFCDFDTDDEGWIVFQRRKYGSEDFNRSWEEYKLGFGDLNDDFWWGNEKLHHMTTGEPMELRIDLEDFNGNKAFAKYHSFRIRSEEHNYKLEVGGYSGSAGDALSDNVNDFWNHNGQEFSTRDRDNDNHLTNCAERFRGGWWFNACFAANLNGHCFGKEQGAGDWQGILWYTFSEKSSLKFAEMKFR
ncbi:fibrinogen-like protein A [Mya arenaria]|uniref:fibrinogen-like protein A n=1 Tax=Mya arenaria TaxID=6604 RepID=UPI0022E7B1CE|nr:fibrinogen-like protein A [Mya arenaria]